MLFLSGGFAPMQPSFGLLFWATVVFLLVWLFLGKFAFKPISKALGERENAIDEALMEAEKARAEKVSTVEEQNRLLNEAKEERIRVISQAKATSDQIVEDGRVKGKEVEERIIAAAKEEAQNRKQEMVTDLMNQTGLLASDIAAGILGKELAGNHEAFIKTKLEEFKKQQANNISTVA